MNWPHVDLRMGFMACSYMAHALAVGATCYLQLPDHAVSGVHGVMQLYNIALELDKF